MLPILLFAVAACSDTPPAVPAATPAAMAPTERITMSPDLAERFATLAADCVHREFPNKVSRTTDTADEMGTPREIFPAFYGCFDWHSSVHGHWLLVRMLRVGGLPDGMRADIAAKLDRSFSAENMAGELANFRRPARGSWERPYGWAWYLQLTAELREWDDPKAAEWLDLLQPLEADIVAATKTWLPKLAYPIHLGTHNQSAFAMTLMHDWAEVADDAEFTALLEERARTYHAGQTDCPLAYEPSGEDFLSACLMTADLMRRVMGGDEFADWLSRFLPGIPESAAPEDADWDTNWLEPGVVLDATDGKLVHLDGVNSSRAWNLANIARALPEGDPRRVPLSVAAGEHMEAGVSAVSDEHYAGSHWLASFATYLMTDRGWE